MRIERDSTKVIMIPHRERPDMRHFGSAKDAGSGQVGRAFLFCVATWLAENELLPLVENAKPMHICVI